MFWVKRHCLEVVLGRHSSCMSGLSKISACTYVYELLNKLRQGHCPIKKKITCHYDMSKRLTRSSSQDVDSRRPEHVIEEKDAEDEDKEEDEDGSDTSNKEEKQHTKARTEDQVVTTILLTIHHMQEKIDCIMTKLGLDDNGSEAEVASS